MHWWWCSQWYRREAYGPVRDDRDAEAPGADSYLDVNASPCSDADDDLALLVGQALLGDPVITHGLVEINVENRVVILDGVVDTEVACIAVSARVWSLPGVRDVCNALIVAQHA